MKTIAKTMILAAVASIALAGSASAARKPRGVDASKLPYGSAGCGLGSAVVGPSDGFGQWFASSTNQSSGQPFAITSGTSNCTAVNEMDSAELRQWMPIFVAQNHSQLAEDLARGEGETIRALSIALQCDSSSVVGTTLKRNYGTIFKTHDADSTSNRIFDVLNAETQKVRCKKAA